MRHLKKVNDFCTCGAKLPEDARFCHKCGKPQREEPEIEALEHQMSASEPQADAVVAPPLPLPKIGFQNPVAVRAAILSSAIATVAGLIPWPGLFHQLWQLLTIAAGGFIAVYFYHRRTGEYLSIRNGLQIGWMTGLFCFIVMMVILALVLAMVASLGESGLKQLTAEAGQPEVAEAMSRMMSNPAMLIFALVSVFFLTTVLASVGGALGSRILDKE